MKDANLSKKLCEKLEKCDTYTLKKRNVKQIGQNRTLLNERFDEVDGEKEVMKRYECTV